MMEFHACFDFSAPGAAVGYRRSAGCGFVDKAALADAPRLNTPQMGANWQPLWWHDGWLADFAATGQGVTARPAPGLPEADLAGRALPLWYRADLPGEGVYTACLRLCGQGGEALVFAGRRRLVWRGDLGAGECREVSFPLDVTPLVPDGENAPALNAAADIVVVGADMQALRLQNARARRVFLLGDSTVTDQSAALPYAPFTSYAGWGQMLGWFLPEGLCVSNHAHSGLTTETFTDGGHWAIVEPRLQPGDVCLMQFGHNDQKLPHLTARGGYTRRLRAYIEAVRAKGAQPVLVTPLARNSWNADGTYNDLLADFAAAVQDLGEAEGVPVIDLHGEAMGRIVAEGREGAKVWFYPGDYTHTNDFGAYLFARYVAGALCAALGLNAPARAPWAPAGPREPLAPPEGCTLTPPEGQGDAFAEYDARDPGAPLTRADALCQITAALRLFPVNGYRSPFADVVGQAPYAGAVQCAVQGNLIPPAWVADGCLHPERSVTLAEFLAVLLPGYATRRPLPQAENDAARAVLAGLIAPDADPAVTLTRTAGAAICRKVHI